MKIKSKDMTFFYRQLATLMNAGVTLIESFDIIVITQVNPAIKKLVYNLKHEVNTGKTLSSAMRKYPNNFDHLSCNLIYIGEQSGKLDLILNRIATQKEIGLKLISKIKSALVYPIIILLTSVVVILMMFTLVIPHFAEFFESFHQPLPRATTIILYMSHLCHSYYWVTIFPILFFFYIYHQYRKNSRLRNFLQTYSLKLPVLSIFLKQLLFVRFTQVLSVLLSSGINIQEGLIMMKMHHHVFFQKTLSFVINRIETGQSLYQALQGTRFFSPFILQMVKVGEESGNLELMLSKIADFYEMENDAWLHRFIQILEPLIILILGVLIGGMLIAMYLPMFKLGSIV